MPTSKSRALRAPTLVREVLVTQLLFAATVGLIALACVWSVASWVVRDNAADWSARWISELEGLGAGLYVDSADPSFVAMDNYIERFPEIVYVRYYAPTGEVIYVESKADEVPFATLDRFAIVAKTTAQHSALLQPRIASRQVFDALSRLPMKLDIGHLVLVVDKFIGLTLAALK